MMHEYPKPMMQKDTGAIPVPDAIKSLRQLLSDARGLSDAGGGRVPEPGAGSMNIQGVSQGRASHSFRNELLEGKFTRSSTYPLFSGVTGTIHTLGYIFSRSLRI